MLWMLGWVVFGVIVGAPARLLMPGTNRGGSVLTMLLGIVAAVSSGFVGHPVGCDGRGEPGGLVMAVLGALVILFVYRRAVKPA